MHLNLSIAPPPTLSKLLSPGAALIVARYGEHCERGRGKAGAFAIAVSQNTGCTRSIPSDDLEFSYSQINYSLVASGATKFGSPDPPSTCHHAVAAAPQQHNSTILWLFKCILFIFKAC